MLECLADLNTSLKNVGTKLHIFYGEPVAVFRYLHRKYTIEKLCFEQDCEPIWHDRDRAVKGTATPYSLQNPISVNDNKRYLYPNRVLFGTKY